jgi:hypothetical protein
MNPIWKFLPKLTLRPTKKYRFRCNQIAFPHPANGRFKRGHVGSFIRVNNPLRAKIFVSQLQDTFTSETRKRLL